MAKKKQQFVKIEFVGTDLVFDRVLYAPVAIGKALPFLHIEKRGGDNWLLVHGGSALFDNLDKPIELNFIRSPITVKIEQAGVEKNHFITKATRLHLQEHCVFHLDCLKNNLDMAQWRMCHTATFIEETMPIETIRITKVD